MYGLTKPASSRLTVMLYSPRFAHAGDEQSEYERVVTVPAYGDAYADVLPGSERGEGGAILGLEDDRLCIGTVPAYLGHDDLLLLRVALLCLFVGGERFRQRSGGGRLYRLLTHLGHILESEHIERADHAYLVIELICHLLKPPLLSFPRESFWRACLR